MKPTISPIKFQFSQPGLVIIFPSRENKILSQENKILSLGNLHIIDLYKIKGDTATPHWFKFRKALLTPSSSLLTDLYPVPRAPSVVLCTLFSELCTLDFVPRSPQNLRTSER